MFTEKTLERLVRGTIGYDPLFTLVETASLPDMQGYPPYNIEKTGETTYRITLALAGMRPQDLDIQVHKGVLTISYGGEEDKADPQRFLHRGIAMRPFRRQFQLAEHVEVVQAAMENGLLHIDLERIVPEDQKPRTIAIQMGAAGASTPGDARAALLGKG